MDSERGKREEELRRERVERPATGPRVDTVGFAAEDAWTASPRRAGSGDPRGTIGAEGEARLEEGVRRGARRAIDEKEQETSGGGGLYGSQIDASHILGAAIAELVGTFVLVFGGTAVAVGAILARPRPARPTTLWPWPLPSGSRLRPWWPRSVTSQGHT